jgi:hypothetical protein
MGVRAALRAKTSPRTNQDMKARILAISTAVFVFAAAGFAQESKPLNISLRIGTFQPNDSSAKDEGKSWFAVGVETRFKNLGVSASNPGMSSYLTLSLDHFSKGDFGSTPILVNYVYRNNELYFTGGAGASFIDEPGESANTRIALALGVGWDFQKGKTPLFVEAKWFGHSGGDKLNGLGLYVGVRL